MSIGILKASNRKHCLKLAKTIREFISSPGPKSISSQTSAKVHPGRSPASAKLCHFCSEAFYLRLVTRWFATASTPQDPNTPVAASQRNESFPRSPRMNRSQLIGQNWVPSCQWSLNHQTQKRLMVLNLTVH